jgi:hypothetical protein
VVLVWLVAAVIQEGLEFPSAFLALGPQGLAFSLLVEQEFLLVLLALLVLAGGILGLLIQTCFSENDLAHPVR